MKWIFLSPHLDDIAFSCGGLVWDLAEAGHIVEVWTITAGDPPDAALSPLGNQLHSRWGLGLDAVQIRRDEDRAACQLLAASPRYFPFLDCIYRKTSSGEFLYPTERAVFGGLDPRETDLLTHLSERLAAEIPRDTRVVAPLGIGNHVDHELTRKAANRLEIPVTFYADYPYAQEAEGRDTLDFLDKAAEWQSVQFPVSEAGLQNWILAAQAYRSQISTFWSDDGDLGLQIREYSDFLGGFKLWKAIEDQA
jgi:LmbE family N-acetylglucosaminyl deacetylase